MKNKNKIPSPRKQNTHSLLRKELPLQAEAEGEESEQGVKMKTCARKGTGLWLSAPECRGANRIVWGCTPHERVSTTIQLCEEEHARSCIW